MDATQDPQQKQPLPPLLVGIAIALLPPLGIYLLWNHPVLKTSSAWRKGAYAWGGLWLLFQIGNFFSGPDEKKPNPANSASTSNAPSSAAKRAAGGGRKNDTAPVAPPERSGQYKRAWDMAVGVGLARKRSIITERGRQIEIGEIMEDLRKAEEALMHQTDPRQKEFWAGMVDGHKHVLKAIQAD
jgi:hypothetical protein